MRLIILTIRLCRGGGGGRGVVWTREGTACSMLMDGHLSDCI